MKLNMLPQEIQDLILSNEEANEYSKKFDSVQYDVLCCERNKGKFSVIGSNYDENGIIGVVEHRHFNIVPQRYTLILYWVDEDGNIQSRTGEYSSFEAAALHASKALKQDDYEVTITVEDGLENTLERAYAESVRG